MSKESSPSVAGSLPAIIRNDAGIYQGNLVPYFRIIFFEARNVQQPYHNFRHMTHVVWLCYQACVYYGEMLTPRQKRDILIAALFHDYDHPGTAGNDDLNVERSIRSMRKHLQPEDTDWSEEIALLMRVTEFPPPPHMQGVSLSLSQLIIRDADLSQALSVAWIQQVIFGLAAEWGKQPLEVLKMQEPFLKNLQFRTDWAQSYFPQGMIDSKIVEARELLELLDPVPAKSAAA